jgi:hypothetical protein
MTVGVQALSQIDAGADIVACTADPVQLIANTVNAPSGTWTTSGTGSFLNADALTTLYTPSAADSTAGSVTLTVTTTGVDPCSAVSDQLVITFGGGLAAEAGTDVIACSTDPNVAEWCSCWYHHGHLEHHGYRFVHARCNGAQRHVHPRSCGLRDRQRLADPLHHG